MLDKLPRELLSCRNDGRMDTEGVEAEEKEASELFNIKSDCRSVAAACCRSFSCSFIDFRFALVGFSGSAFVGLFRACF